MYYTIKKYYIAHFGVGHLNGGNSGRYKWGSGDRPYQRYEDSNGNLTREGKNKFNKYLEINRVNRPSQQAINNYTEKYGLSKNGKDYVFRKNSVIQRVTDNDNESMDKRKYATFTKIDNDNYRTPTFLNLLDMKNKNEARADIYFSNKDMKVASYDTVMETLMNKYGNQKISEFYGSDKRNDNEIFRDYYNKYIKKYENKTVKDMYISNYDYDSYHFFIDKNNNRATTEDDKVLEQRYRVGIGVANDLTRKLRDADLDDYFKSKGYDAIIDAEDKAGGSAFAPLIILDPSKSMKKIASMKLY